MAQDLQSKKTTHSVNPLLQALQLEDQIASHKEIAGILEEFDEKKSVALFFDALLKSPDQKSRKRIVKELVTIGSAKAVEMLEQIMNHDFDPEVQREAVEALRQIGSDAAVDVLIDKLRSGDDWSGVCWATARALASFDSGKVVDALIQASKDDDPLGRVAVRSLVQIGSDRAVEGLIAVMQDSFPGSGLTSYDAMAGLVRLGTDRAIDGLFQAWSRSSSIHGNRLSVSIYLSQFKPKRLIAPLCQRLQNKTLTSNDRESAAEMLGLIGTEKEIPLLKSVWRDDESKEVGWRSLRAAEQIALSELEKKGERERTLEETRAFIAHEFRHVLTPLNAYAKMLDEALGNSEINKEKLLSLTARIRKQTDTGFDLVNQYLDYSRPLSPQFAETHVNELLELVLEEFKPELENRKIALRSQFAENDDAEGEKGWLAQVFRNVIDNAIQAMEKEKEGTLVVTTEAAEDSLSITIRDTGGGITPAQLPHIFNFGFTTKSGSHGAGFGLALSRRIVEAHNGSIVIASDGKRRGTSVVITLPRKQTEIKNGRQHPTPADR